VFYKKCFEVAIFKERNLSLVPIVYLFVYLLLLLLTTPETNGPKVEVMLGKEVQSSPKMLR
jgi:hypothetical protein